MVGEKTCTQTLSTGFEGEIGSQGVMGKSKKSSKSLGREITVFQITTSVFYLIFVILTFHDKGKCVSL